MEFCLYLLFHCPLLSEGGKKRSFSRTISTPTFPFIQELSAKASLAVTGVPDKLTTGNLGKDCSYLSEW